ncbi:MAG: AAA family ATPase [Bryobacteraceae bacterium]
MSKAPSRGTPAQNPENSSESPRDLVTLLSQKVMGQPGALKYIVPYIDMFQAGLAPTGRPAGIFLLLGPTGTGKTKTVEAVAEILHGSEKNLLRVDCGEFQMEHEVAKLIGAPPGYLGHRETAPIITQKKLNEVTSEGCDLAIVLFDEIEKAAPSVTRLLLGILDKATLRLGDNTTVDFEKTFLFLTSNLGAREIMKELKPDFGFQAGSEVMGSDSERKIESVALAAVRRKFSPEFVNRLDAVVTYKPLHDDALSAILNREILELQRHVDTRLGERCFSIDVPADTRKFLLRKGTSKEYGARELKRTIHRHLTQPLATLVASRQIEPGSTVRVDVSADGDSLLIHAAETLSRVSARPTVLLVDDNRDLLRLFERQLAGADWTVLTAETGAQCDEVVRKQGVDVVVLDYLLPDANGVDLACHIRATNPFAAVIIATGAELTTEDHVRCTQNQFPLLRKPFLAEELTKLIRACLPASSKEGEKRASSPPTRASRSKGAS